MKKFTALLGAAVVVLASTVGGAQAATYKADPAHSSVAFKIMHEVSNVWGIFTAVSGTVTLDDSGGSVDISVKATSINTGIEKRDEHLKGNDFFATAQFPTITFKSSKVTKSGDAYDVTGNLTLHGVTKEITVKLTASEEKPGMAKNTVRGFETTFTIKRSEYGMAGFIPVVGDDVTLFVSVEAGKQ